MKDRITSALAVALSLCTGLATAFTLTIDPAKPGKPVNQGIRGMAISDDTIDRTSFRHGVFDALELSNNSALRGVAGGLFADRYDWRTRNVEPRPPTLEFLRYARNRNAKLFITVNTRGLVIPNPDEPGKYLFYTSSPLVLARLAADWVKYVNQVVPEYRQGEIIADPEARRVLNLLDWSTFHPGDRWDTLLHPTEPAVDKVTYWEIGNEPTVTVARGIGVSNGGTLDAEQFYERYKLITRAMLAVDPNIKVGPCIVNGDRKRERKHLNLIFADPDCRVDFVSYHPYQRMGDEDAPPAIEKELRGIYKNQRERWKTIRDIATSNSRNPENIEMVASEQNVSYWSYNDTRKEGEMAHAIGCAETVFCYARLGLTASHYWIWPANADDGTRYPSFKAYEKLRDYLGTRLVNTTIDGLLRVHVTADDRQGRVVAWVLNFSNSDDRELTLQLRNMDQCTSVSAYRLGKADGTTNLKSAILSPRMPGGPLQEVDWQACDVRVQGRVATVPAGASELTMVIFENPRKRPGIETDWRELTAE